MGSLSQTRKIYIYEFGKPLHGCSLLSGMVTYCKFVLKLRLQANVGLDCEPTCNFRCSIKGHISEHSLCSENDKGLSQNLGHQRWYLHLLREARVSELYLQWGTFLAQRAPNYPNLHPPSRRVSSPRKGADLCRFAPVWSSCKRGRGCELCMFVLVLLESRLQGGANLGGFGALWSTHIP